MWDRLDAVAQDALLLAQHEAARGGHHMIEPAHILLGLLETEDEGRNRVLQLLGHSGLSTEELRLYAQSALSHLNGPQPGQKPRFSPAAQKILNGASAEAARMYRTDIGPDHLLLALLRPGSDPLAQVLASLNIDIAQTRNLAARFGQRTGTPREGPLECLGADALAVLELAHSHAKRTYCSRIGTGHLLLALMEEPTGLARATAYVHGFDVDRLTERARASLQADGEFATAEKRFTPAARRALTLARLSAVENRHRWTGADDLFNGLLPREASAWETLATVIGLRPKLEDPAGEILWEQIENPIREEPVHLPTTRRPIHWGLLFHRVLWSTVAGLSGCIASLWFLLVSKDWNSQGWILPNPHQNQFAVFLIRVVPALAGFLFVWGFLGYHARDKRQNQN